MTYAVTTDDLVLLREYRNRTAAPRLTARAVEKYAGDVALFIRECIVIDDAQGDEGGTMPFLLWPAQEELLQSIVSERLLFILKARQLGITWLACAYALHLCLFKPSRLVLTFSIGQDEANEMMRRISAMYRRMPAEVKAALPQATKDNTEEMQWGNGSRIQSLPSRKSAGSGYTASLIILDEFAKNENAEKLYTAVKPTIDGGGKMLILSTANGTANLFYDMCQRAREGVGKFAFRFLPWHVRPGRDQAWYEATAIDAVDAALMKQEYPATPDEAFEATDVDTFLPSIALWDACEDAELPPLGQHEPCVLAMDAGESNDTFALVIASAHPKDQSRLAVRYAEAFVPTPGIPLDFDAIEQVARSLIARYAVQELAYDPFLLGQFIRRLTSGAASIRTPAVPFSQGADRLEADKGLYDLSTSRRVAHDGTLVQLRSHLANANRKIDPLTRKMRIVKRTYPLKIDLAVACSMACHRMGALAVPRELVQGQNILADWRG